MEMAALAIVAGFVLVYGLISRRLKSTPVTGPIVFVTAGLLLGPTGIGVLEDSLTQGTVGILAETTLVLLLFTDAIRIDVKALRHQIQLPARLLAVSLPLTVAVGTVAAVLIFSELSVWEAALLAAILAPTDAALGQAVVTNLRVPVRIRQALNVESGLNDGLILPVITVLLAVAAANIDIESPSYWAGFAARQIGGGVLVGVLVGHVGGRLVDIASSRGWMDGTFRQLGTLAIGVGAFAGAVLLGGNGFVAAFTAGLAFGVAARGRCSHAYDFAEDEGNLLALLTFMFFGAALVGPSLERLTWPVVIYALASLTIARMLPVAASMFGTKLGIPTVAYLGWFGPRGLASILFGLLALEEAALPGAPTIVMVVTWTVVASIFLHGATSVPLSNLYASWFERSRSEDMPEATEVEAMPTR